MATITISREKMIMDLNNHFTGLIESWTCGGERKIDMDKSFLLFDKWINLKGEEVQLILPNTVLFDSWNLHETSELPDYFVIQEDKGNTTLVERIWMRLNGFNQ